MKRHTLFGPPGTGKTTYLMKLIMEDLKTTAPERLAFVSYTKQGTYEGARRAHKQFNLKAADTPFFRTIHSLCFKELGMRKYDMLQQKHYKMFSEKTGIPFTGYYTQDFNSPNDAYLHAISMERHNYAMAMEMSKDMNEKKYNYIKENYAALKKQLGIKDFDDLLEDYLHHCRPFNVDIAYVDEAQDLTPLQWSVVKHMFKNADKVVIAGDDDQSVYEWAGADTKQFLSFSKESTILHKSYRLPEKVCKLAATVSQDIAERKRKEFVSNGEEGEVVRANSIHDIPFKGGELILARTNYKLRELCDELELKGVYYIRKGYACIQPITLKGIQAYSDFLIGETDEQPVKKFGNLFKEINVSKDWQDVINKPPARVAFYERLIQNGGLEREPVLLETFHSSKGTENDHVIVSPDLSKRVYNEFAKQRDAELRCLYVGLTRTKNKLTLLAPKWSNYYPSKYFKL